jgi:hypothetical protein
VAAPVPVRGLGELAATGFAAAGSAEGRAWIAAVPFLIASLARQWDLTIASEEFRHRYSAVVLPVGQRGRPLVLKLAWPPDRVRGEADALVAWRVRGAVELVARDVPRGALLLERLDASRSLASIPLAEAAALARDPGRRLVHTDLHYGKSRARWHRWRGSAACHATGGNAGPATQPWLAWS